MKIDNKITGAVHRIINVEVGPSYTNPSERVFELQFKSSQDSNCTNCVVVSEDVLRGIAAWDFSKHLQ
jgi:hypothetical protein